jgi:PUA domain protein
MFKKFDARSDVSTSTQVKASIQRSLKGQMLDQHPLITEAMLEELIPKKGNPLVQYKVGPHLILYCRRIEPEDPSCKSATDEPILYQPRDGPLLPTLRLVHQYPTLEFKHVTVDRGAIPFVLGGAHIMCPGLTNPGGFLPEDRTNEDDGVVQPGLAKGEGVVVFAEGKEYALAVGTMAMSSLEMLSIFSFICFQWIQ